MGKYNAIVYRGRAIAFTIQEYETRRSIELLQNKPHVFDHTLDSAEVNYYNKLNSIGVKLLYTQMTQPKEVKNSTKTITELSPTKIESFSVPEEPDVPQEVLDQFHELEAPEVPLMDTKDEEVVSEESTIEKLDKVEVDVVEGCEDELSEYLDMNYDDDTIHELASELEISGIRSNYKKSTVISKLVEEAYDAVYKLAFQE